MQDKTSAKEYLTSIVIFALLIFALYSNAIILVKNYRLGQVLQVKKEAVAKQELSNLKLKNLIAYYQTSSFQEVEARRRLSLQRPDERVFTSKVNNNAAASTGAVSDNLYEDISPAAPVAKTNIEAWWEYLFGN